MTGALGLMIGLVPVVLLLLALRLLDSYKLVRRREVAASLAIGAGVGAVSFVAHTLLIGSIGLDAQLVRRAFAPALEETLKAIPLFVLVRRERVGFMVDAGIHGFAVGTGFALAENVYYAFALGTSDLGLWLARGLGTAVLHGSTTAIVGILTKELADRHGWHWTRGLPGLALAITIHGLYNQLLLPPLLATAALIVVMPLLLLAVFDYSERATRQWLGVGLDHDAERLEVLLGGELPGTPVGDYLESVRTRFEPAVVADMLCLLQIHTELSLRAKGILIARAAGVELPLDDAVRANLKELRFLERSVGPTGRLALLPFLRTTSRELWQVTRLARG